MLCCQWYLGMVIGRCIVSFVYILLIMLSLSAYLILLGSSLKLQVSIDMYVYTFRGLGFLHWFTRVNVPICVAPGRYQLKRYIIPQFRHHQFLVGHDTH